MHKNLLLFSCVILLSLITGCSDFRAALSLQDDYAENFSISETSQTLNLSQEFDVSIYRGTIETKYSAIVPKGLYVPIASSKGRIFYQAPNGFKYFTGGRLKSKLGGIVQIKKNNFSEFYVWYFLKELDYFEIDPTGDWHSSIKPGFLNIASRPWIEGDLKIIREPQIPRT